MNNNLTEIVCIIDRSTSMGSLTNEVISGINTFITDQRKLEGEAKISLVLFDSVINHVYERIDIKEIPLLDNKSYRTQGCTAMYDAIGYSINNIGETLHNMNEDDRPSKVLFCIMTDGQDNESKEFNAKNIKDMVEHQTEKYAWEFIFLAANIDVDTSADSIGIRSRMAFGATAKGVSDVYNSLSSYTTSYRSAK